MRKLLSLLVLFGLVQTFGQNKAFGQNQATSQNRLSLIDSLVNRRVADYELSGNILIAEKGKALYQRSIGLADTRSGRHNNPNSCFQLASVSKLFTAVAVLQLKDKGRLKLDDPVNRYIPELENRLITIRQLLSHTSGLSDLQMLEKPYLQDTSKVFRIQDMPWAINNDPGAFVSAPGERWSYSNSGYTLLALIVERISGLDFAGYLRKNVFLPARMGNTYIATVLLKVHDPHRSVGYDYPGFAPWILQRADSLPANHIELLHLNGLIGPGNVFSTAGDLLSFDRALYRGKIVTRASLREAFTPIRLNNGQLATAGWKNTRAYQGLGWRILADSTHGKVVFHSGGEPGAVTMFIRNITKDQTVIVLNNITHRSTHGTAMSLLYLLSGGEAQTDKISIANRFARTLVAGGIDQAWTAFNTVKSDTARYYLDEREMNYLGLTMFYNGYKEQGTELLRLNTVLFPGSSNVYDSYASVLAALGKKQEAIRMYQKTLDLDPGSSGAQKALLDLKAN